MKVYYKRESVRDLYRILRDVRAKWKEIGLLLGLSLGELNAIETDRQQNTERCLMDCLDLWLSNSINKENQTNKCLAFILLKVGEANLAFELYPSVKEHWQYTVSRLRWNINLTYVSVSIGLICFVLGVIYHYALHNDAIILDPQPVMPGYSQSLPSANETLFGRDKEVQLILQYLNDTEVQVVTLFGSPGFGKSAIAKCVGKLLLQKGMDVHYLVVEYFADVHALQEEIVNISGVTEKVRFVSWVKSITRETLLILDNVDGYHWVQDKSRSEFQKHILSILQEHSDKLKILITSQQQIRSSKRFRSSQLLSLDAENCVYLLNHSVTEVVLSSSEAATICDLVGGAPLALEVLAATLSPPVNCSVKYVIERLNDTSMLHFIADKGQLTSEDRILSALELAFEFIKKEHQVCALLTARFTGSFSLPIIKSIVTAELMNQFSSSFRIEDCFYELNVKSFIEVISSVNGNKPIKYHFHVLIRTFLEVTVEKFNISDALDSFWKIT